MAAPCCDASYCVQMAQCQMDVYTDGTPMDEYHIR